MPAVSPIGLPLIMLALGGIGIHTTRRRGQLRPIHERQAGGGFRSLAGFFIARCVTGGDRT
jgi:hypothetical protein